MEKDFILYNITSTVITVKIFPFFLSSDFHISIVLFPAMNCVQEVTNFIEITNL